MPKIATATVLIALLLTTASAQPAPLGSFSYASTGCNEGVMTWGNTSAFKITSAVSPGAGVWPSGKFWVRRVSLTYFGSVWRWLLLRNDWAIVGHSGPHGDWITSPVLSGRSETFTFPADAAPLFTPGEYFDVHAPCGKAVVSISYVPAE